MKFLCQTFNSNHFLYNLISNIFNWTMEKKMISFLIFCMGLFQLVCDCDDMTEDITEPDIFIEGRVVEMIEDEHLLEVFFETDEGQRISIFTPSETDDCGYLFEMGEEYVVFAYYNYENNYYGEADTYYTTICSFTMSREEWEGF